MTRDEVLGYTPPGGVAAHPQEEEERVYIGCYHLTNTNGGSHLGQQEVKAADIDQAKSRLYDAARVAYPPEDGWSMTDMVVSRQKYIRPATDDERDDDERLSQAVLDEIIQRVYGSVKMEECDHPDCPCHEM